MDSRKALFITWILFIPYLLMAQDIIRLKNGSEIEIQYVRQTKDTLVYEKIHSPGFYHKILFSEIDTMYPVSGPRPEERPETIQRKYESNKRIMTAGLVILAGGAAITLGAGIYALTGGINEALGGGDNPGVVPALAGLTICVTGIILTAVGSTGKNTCKKKLEKINVDFHSDSGITGVRLSFRF